MIYTTEYNSLIHSYITTKTHNIRYYGICIFICVGFNLSLTNPFGLRTIFDILIFICFILKMHFPLNECVKRDAYQ